MTDERERARFVEWLGRPDCPVSREEFENTNAWYGWQGATSSTAERVPDSIIGNVLDHWKMLPGDTRQDLKDEDAGFYNAMERLEDWIEENR